jgi:hypothetical protein
MIYDLKSKEDVAMMGRKLRKFIAQGFTVIIDKKREKISNPQMRYIYLMFRFFAVDNGFTNEEAKTEIKRAIGYTYEKNGKPFLQSLTALDTKTATEFIERMRNWSATQGFYMPAPNEPMEWVENYIKQNSGWDI